MAEQLAQKTQYQYAANSNLVLQADRSLITSRKNEPTGEPESLYGKIDPKDFGSRAVRDAVKVPPSESKTSTSAAKRVKTATSIPTQGGYQPKTKETREAFDLILAFVNDYFGEYSAELVYGAADTILETLKQDGLKDLDKKKLIDQVLGQRTSTEAFAQLTGLGKRITDYFTSSFSSGTGGGEEGEGVVEEIVPVTFDDETGDKDHAGLTDSAVYEVQELEEPAEGEEEDGDEEEGNEEDTELQSGIQTAADLFDPDEGSGFRTEIPGRSKSGNIAALSKDKVKPHEIDAFWLQRKIGEYYADSMVRNAKATEALSVLSNEQKGRPQIENELHSLFDYAHFELVKLLSSNRDVVVWCSRLARAGAEGLERENVENAMRSSGREWILKELHRDRATAAEYLQQEDITMGSAADKSAEEAAGTLQPKNHVNLDALVFQEGSHLMTNKTCRLPAGSTKRTKKGYEIITVPAPKTPRFPESDLFPIEKLPVWARNAFPPEVSRLNVIQSKVKPCAFDRDENLLLCAPTGAGKTNVALLCMLREIGKHLNEDGTVALDEFKIIYVAPMKALVQEMVRTFGDRLACFGIKVAELSGDRQMTKAQISETQVIFTTPEKWDVITRKANDTSYTTLVRLIVMDEIHLLHDDRGPVLENLVARTLRTINLTQLPVRLVGLSATLPNYQDVAAFLRVEEDSGLFFFDNSYRPCPLEQQFIGITERKPLKRYQLLNEIAYEKALEQMEAGEDRQLLIFVHSRKETAKTAKFIRDMAMERETIGKFVRFKAAYFKEVLSTEAESAKEEALKELLPYGFAVHHAGMNAVDRKTVEDLFKEGAIRVLVSTATLAWGVNLPAHAVMVKGTQMYVPEKGSWVELSPQDMLQMLGRAGRPQYDTYGEGIILTTQSEMQYYLSLMNEQLPIESQFISRLADSLNAEVVLGSIRNREEAVQWLGYTYLFVRMIRNGELYGATAEDFDQDPWLRQKRVDLIHAAATLLDKCQLIQYVRKSGELKPTELGRIASHYYLSHKSVLTYHQHLRPVMSLIELFRTFALSEEFRPIPVRREEKLELSKLLERVPIPVKEGIEEGAAKINVLLQAYISQLKLEGFALMSDLVYVTQSAGRILRAMFEMALERGWAQVARHTLELCKMVEKRQWLSMSPLRQIAPSVLGGKRELVDSFNRLVQKLEKRDYPWERMVDLDVVHLGELVGEPKAGKLLHKMVHQFPRLRLESLVQPLTPSLLKIELVITPEFLWEDKLHGSAEQFWIMVEDVDGEGLLHHESFLLKRQYAQQDHSLSFYVTMKEPVPPNWFISVVSDRWLHCERRLAVSFKHLILPQKFTPHTELYDLQPLPLTEVSTFVSTIPNAVNFNPIQTQAFATLYQSDENCFLGAASGCGKTWAAELALLRLWSTSPAEIEQKAVYLSPSQLVIDERLKEWTMKYPNKSFAKLTGEVLSDLALLQQNDVVLSLPRYFDTLGRKWTKRQILQQSLQLVIADDLHVLAGGVSTSGGGGGQEEEAACYEIVCSRLRYMSKQLGREVRLVALSLPAGSVREVSEWLGCKPQHVYNFSPLVRMTDLEVHFQAFNIPHFASMMLAMTRPLLQTILKASVNSVLVFVPSRKLCKQVTADLLTLAQGRLCNKEQEETLDVAWTQGIKDQILRESIEKGGVGYLYEASEDQELILWAFQQKKLPVLIASREWCWSTRLAAELVVVMGTKYYAGKEHRYLDYPLSELHKMLGKAGLQLQQGRVVIFTSDNAKKRFYTEQLQLALSLESCLEHSLHDHFNAEIDAGMIENKQDAVDYLTWTLMYRRLTQNPNYYNLAGVTQRHISDHLSELVENTLQDLAKARCIRIEENDLDLAIANLGMIAAHYRVSYVSMELLGLSLTERTNLKSLLGVLSCCKEFDTLPVRHHEDLVLSRLQEALPVKLSNPQYNLPSVKTHLLLQAHFSRLSLPADLAADQRSILSQTVHLLQACVNVLSTQNWLKPCLLCMELSQMCVQAIWHTESWLKQLPFFDDSSRLERFRESGVETIFDFLEMNSSDRLSLLQLPESWQLKRLSAYTKRYPSIDVAFTLDTSESMFVDQPVTMTVTLERETSDEEGGVEPVDAPYFPGLKQEGWWCVVGNEPENTILGLKHVIFTAPKTCQVKFQFVPQKPGPQQLKFLLICDAYLGCDQDYPFEINVLPASPSESDADDGGGGDGMDIEEEAEGGERMEEE